ncbi:hypothetical protein BDFB_000074 [Asbolus verrucosus]|uniref:C2H2-type domain-containing protein n=1 Tax=Asbolus verrucosus TaxID=1661398 RepID=A0A482V7K3_ASBVE|nr:hypothetical protein BDFB_000074 [Asbolus verrucosus]
MRNLKTHLRCECGKEPQFACSYEGVPGRKAIRSGVQDKYFLCEKCNRSYKYYGNLQSHLKLDCGKEAKFKCQVPGCHYKSKIENNLKIHIINKHPQTVDYD